MRADGIDIPDFQPDGKIKRSKSKWAIGFSNHTNGGHPFIVAIYGDWARGNVEFKFQSNVKLDAAERQKVLRQINDARAKAEKDKSKEQAATALEAEAYFNELPEVSAFTHYMVHKDIRAFYGARSDGFSLIVPIRDVRGKIWSTQTISKDAKRYRAGGRIKGCFHLIGEVSDKLYICEGFATAASIHLATGSAVAVAFDCGNLLSIATELKHHYKTQTIIICGDDDRFKEKNAGREKAEAAAQKLLIAAVFPKFKNDDTEPTDFNDLHLLEGLDAVKAQVSRAEVAESIQWVTETQTMNSLLTKDLTVILPHWRWSKATDKKESAPTVPIASVENLQKLFEVLGVWAKYNVVSKIDEVIIPGLKFTPDNHANAVLAHVTSWCERLNMPSRSLGGYITAVCDANAYNPIADWIDAKPWDGVDRLEDFYKTVTAVNEKTDMNLLAMKERLLKVWLVQAVAALYSEKGLSASGVLVFVGEQHLGKTHWFKRLLPPELREYLDDGVTLNTSNKDSVLSIIGHWLVEFGELDGTFRKSHAAHLKAFITKNRDKVRRPYSKLESTFARRTVFFASVNDANFLVDPTGNRRFWTIECEAIDYAHKIDMQQLWAQVKNEYVNGAEIYLSADEVKSLNEHNENFEKIDPIEELLRSKFEWDVPRDKWVDRMSATDICLYLNINITSMHSEPTKVAGVLSRKFGLKSDRKFRLMRQYTMPPKSNIMPRL